MSACSLGISLVHTHIKRRVFPVSKASGRCIQLIGRNPQVQINAVYLLNAKVMKHGSNVFIITPDYGNFVRKRLQAFCGRRDGIRVLVDADQASVLPKTATYLIGMSASAEGSIYINAVRFDIQTVNRFI